MTQVPATEIKVTVIMIAMYYAALSTTEHLAPDRTTSTQACTEQSRLIFFLHSDLPYKNSAEELAYIYKQAAYVLPF